MKTNRIRIAFVLTPITFGGAEQVSLNLLRTYDREQFDIRPVLITRPWEPVPYFADQLRQLGLPYEQIYVSHKKNEGVWRVVRLFRQLFELLKRGNFHIVHTQGYIADICGLPTARLLSIPSLSTCHGFIINDRNLRIYNFLDKSTLRLCSIIMAVSQSISEELIGSGLRAERITVLPNGVQTDFNPLGALRLRNDKRKTLQISDSELVIGYLGRLSEEKGLIYLIEAAALLQRENQKVKVLLVGEGPEQEKLQKLTKLRNLENTVTFVGFQTDTANWLAAVDIFVLPSLTEGTPMAMLEAMAAGKPVIATRVGGIPSIITDGINGFLIPPGRAGMLAEKILTLKNNSAMRKGIALEGKKTIDEKYNILKWCEKVEDLYTKVVNIHRKS